MTSDNDRRRGLLARLRGRPAARSRGRRRLGAAVRLIAALTLAGGAYTAFAPGVQAQDNPPLTGAAAEGQALFDVSCVTCHGRNAQGVEGRGPSLIGVGSASVEFQVSTGRMPMARQEAQAERKPPVFTDEQVRQLGAVHPGARRRPAGPAGRPPRGRRPGHRRRAVPDQLLVRATPSAVAAARSPRASTPRACDAGDRRADLRRDAQRPAEHAGLRRQPAHPGAEARHHRLHPGT